MDAGCWLWRPQRALPSLRQARTGRRAGATPPPFCRQPCLGVSRSPALPQAEQGDEGAEQIWRGEALPCPR